MSDLTWGECVVAIADDPDVLQACRTVSGDLPTAQEAIAQLKEMEAAAEEYMSLREWYEERAAGERILANIDRHLRGEA